MFLTAITDTTSITLVEVPPQPLPMPSLHFWPGPGEEVKRLAAPRIVGLLPPTCPVARPARQRAPSPAQEKKRLMAAFQARIAPLPLPVRINVNGRDGQLYVYSGGKIAFSLTVRLAPPPCTTLHARRPGEDWSESYRCTLYSDELLALRERFAPPTPAVPAAPVDETARFEADLHAELTRHAGHRLTFIGRGALVTITDLTAGAGILRLRRTWDNAVLMEEFVPTYLRDRGQHPGWQKGYAGVGREQDYLWPLVDRLVEEHNAALEPAAA